ncbi:MULTISPECIES: sphingomyelin phosphodiesterase [Streptomyces]|uniref:sphingomyelin phosphodiesterase n=1 Tax=Streptomyces TaxID=1883 RepID=UPI00103956D6|nr:MULTISPECIES: sphingomyelin phosphodiesterase [Streptomyces]MBT3073025.1 sphingomyelin phosphodiesterase [Streptomyces sp. COG21]MBT3089634.1 sphingomyelin phosphodiesterase [Streptomyces sp. CYG21]MBT3103019.1 sphingomyelin phosphodiesterase [Streptomyces sp. COG19]MBT3114243.1 sphingomyelin phosphodiesterase [Streptomyces sp. CYG20]MDI7789392.1 sphingomyelin phosphodiesterase [Streptomyces cavourensis]
MPHSAFRRISAVALTAALAAVPMAVNAPSATAATTADTPSLRVLSYNAFLFSKTLHPNWGQDHRAAEIPKTSFFRGNDVVVIQEAFDNGASDALLRNSAAQYPYQTPVVGRSKSGWDATGGSYSATTPEDGGVTILSKWPIVRKEQYVYKDACGADWWSNKGFAYVVLNVNGARVHVVGTHAQSTDPGCSAGEAATMRSRQFKALDAFLDAKKIPASEQVVVAGDFNVDGHSAEYASFLKDADLVAPDTRTGHRYSFDTRDNSIASERYPNDPREDLDHVLHRAGHAKPAGWNNDVIKEQSAPWTVSSWGKSYTYTNLSDHYPVIGAAN